ncbi:hypothetical protein [Streptodolium elevatio]|uniref:Secreted protein n=1 Tax=Streptodolium elevatio TaxID=3157996 RepID=A0ABV3D847_9ACTN
MRSGMLAVGLAFAVGCGSSSSSGDGRQCTMIGSRVGVGLEIAAQYAERTAAAHMRACAGDVCREGDLQLSPSSSAVPLPCTGEVCGAQATPTGAKNGFLGVPELTGAPLRVSLTLSDAAGAEVLVREIEVTPSQTYPNGPDCGPGGFQASLAVGADGVLAAR